MSNNVKIAPSILSANFSILGEEIKKLDESQQKDFQELMRALEEELPFKQISMDVNDNKID